MCDAVCFSYHNTLVDTNGVASEDDVVTIKRCKWVCTNGRCWVDCRWSNFRPNDSFTKRTRFYHLSNHRINPIKAKNNIVIWIKKFQRNIALLIFIYLDINCTIWTHEQLLFDIYFYTYWRSFHRMFACHWRSYSFG